MRGNMKVMWIVVATWVWWNAVVGPAWVCPFMVTFTTIGATCDSYKNFIEELRAQLASGEKLYGIRVMRERSTVLDYQRFVLVELSNGAADFPVTLAVDVTNAYVVAYRTGNQSFFLPEDDPKRPFVNPFPSAVQQRLPFSGSYPHLEKVAKAGREEIQLGKVPLENAIWDFCHFDPKNQKRLARSLIVVIQMVSEAARFGYIESRVCESIDRSSEFAPGQVFLPGLDILSRENEWSALSKAVQQSDRLGVFSRRVELRSTSNELVCVGSASDALSNGLAIMLFSPRSSELASSSNAYQCHPVPPALFGEASNGSK